MAARPPVRLAYEVRAMTEKGDELDSLVLTKGFLSRVYCGTSSFYRSIDRLETNGWVIRQSAFTWAPTSRLKELITRTSCDAGHQARI